MFPSWQKPSAPGRKLWTILIKSAACSHLLTGDCSIYSIQPWNVTESLRLIVFLQPLTSGRSNSPNTWLLPIMLFPYGSHHLRRHSTQITTGNQQLLMTTWSWERTDRSFCGLLLQDCLFCYSFPLTKASPSVSTLSELVQLFLLVLLPLLLSLPPFSGSISLSVCWVGLLFRWYDLVRKPASSSWLGLAEQKVYTGEIKCLCNLCTRFLLQAFIITETMQVG